MLSHDGIVRLVVNLLVILEVHSHLRMGAETGQVRPGLRQPKTQGVVVGQILVNRLLIETAAIGHEERLARPREHAGINRRAAGVEIQLRRARGRGQIKFPRRLVVAEPSRALGRRFRQRIGNR